MADLIVRNLIDVTVSPDVTTMDYFLGTRNNGDGTGTDYLYTYTQIAATLKKTIIVATGGTTLTDSYFSNSISEIVAYNQTWVIGEDFTQTGTTITLINGSAFLSGQKIIAKI